MVERLKTAIEKARRERAASTAAAPPEPERGGTAIWRDLPELAVDDARMERERVVSRVRADRASEVFDVLRTRLMQVCADRGWRRIGVTSPTKGCGKSVVSVNLAFSAARHRDAKVALVDLDMRAPRLSHVLGAEGDWRLGAFLRGEADIPETFGRIGDNLAAALNNHRERDATEILLSEVGRAALQRADKALGADLMLFDLPPLLASDDAVGIMPMLDGVLLIAAAGETTAEEIQKCEHLITPRAVFVGVVLNKCSDPSLERYSYDT